MRHFTFLDINHFIQKYNVSHIVQDFVSIEKEYLNYRKIERLISICVYDNMVY